MISIGYFHKTHYTPKRSLGGRPSLKIAKLLETHKHKIDDILTESLDHEKEQLKLYFNVVEIAKEHLGLEEFCRQMLRKAE